MAEANTAEKEALAEKAFGAGFGDTPPAETPAKVVEDAAAEPDKPEVPAEPPAKAAKPEYVRVTKQDWDNAKANLGKVSSLESQVAKLTGAMPKADLLVQQVMEKVQAHTPAGEPLVLTDEDFAEFKETFPEVGETMRKSLDKILKRMNGRGGAAALDPGAIEKVVEATLTKRAEAETTATREKELSGLIEVYPNWGEIVGRPPPGAEPVQTDWRKWATANDPKALETDSPSAVQASIAKFIESQKAAAAKPDKGAARRAVIADAVTPRAETQPPPLHQPQSAEEAFASGFKAGKPH